MAQTDEKITKLEEALMEVFSFQSEEYCHRRYYEEIFLSGFMGKIYDKANKYDSRFIKKLVRYFQTNQVIFKDMESEIIEKTIKELIKNPGEENEKTSDEIRYELEIEENGIGLFGYFIPLAEREITIKNFTLYHELLPTHTEGLYTIKDFKKIIPIRNNIKNVLDSGLYNERIIIIHKIFSDVKIEINKDKKAYFAELIDEREKSMRLENNIFLKMQEFAHINKRCLIEVQLAINIFDLMNGS